MSLERTREVDVMGVDKETGYATLAIADDMDWSDERKHLAALQDKIYAYLDFVESGEVDQKYPQGVGRNKEIRIYAKYDFPQVGLNFLKNVATVVEQAGCRLLLTVLREADLSAN